MSDMLLYYCCSALCTCWVVDFLHYIKIIYYKKNEIKLAKRTPYLFTYEPPFQKSWIRPWTGV